MSIAEDLINNAEQYSGTEFVCKEDLVILAEAAHESTNHELFNDIAFGSKYVNGLFRTLKKADEIKEINSVEHIKKDLQEAFVSLTSKLQHLINITPPEHSERLKSTYLASNEEGFSALTKLLLDFEEIKKFLNYLQHS